MNANATATFGDNDVLIVVDVQNDFCPAGALAVPRGDEVVPIVNRMAARFRNVVLTQDWHPRRHLSFASSHPGRQPFETIAAAYGPQVLWPDHCVQGTPGAAFHPRCKFPMPADCAQGHGPRDRSRFGVLRERPHHADRPGRISARARFYPVFLAGLALDFCVRYSAEDARREGFPYSWSRTAAAASIRRFRRRGAGQLRRIGHSLPADAGIRRRLIAYAALPRK